MRILRRTDDAYEAARRDAVWRANTPARFPRIIVQAHSSADVAAAVRLARAEGLRIGVRSGGHSWTSPHLRDGSLLIDVSRMNAAALEPGGRTVWCGPGAKGRQVNKMLEPHGLIGAFGHHDTVGVGGFTMCGGFGWNAREWGNGCTNVEAVEVVTAEGDIILADATQNTDYLWAARGAGAGFFGVVTGFRIRVHQRPPLIHCAYSFYLDALEDTLGWAHDVLPQVPRFVELIASSSAYDAEGGPAPVRVTVSALAFGKTEAESRDALADVFKDFSVRDRAFFAKDPTPSTLDERYDSGTRADPPGFRYACDNIYSDAPRAQVIPLMRGLFSDPPTPRTHIFWQDWGPVQTLPDMAFSVQGNLYLGAYTVWTDPAQDIEMMRWPVEQMRRLEAISTGEGQMNDENMAGRTQRYLSVAAAARLETYRARHDPDGLFLSYLTETSID
jgi:FAD/FMN-containing dehydrogenase